LALKLDLNGETMPNEDSESKKIQLFKSGEGDLEFRRAVLAATRVGGMEKPPDLVMAWRIIRKRRWTILTAFGVLFGIVLVGTLLQKPVYRAKALIEIDKENPGLVTAQEIFQLDEVTDAYLETQYKVLNSDDLAERVIGQLHLDRVTEFQPPVHHWPSIQMPSRATRSRAAGNGVAGPDAALREAVLEYFQSRLNVKPIRRSRAVEITFDSLDPNLAARVVNAMATNYMQKNLEARWDAAQKASEWLSQQLADLKSKLENSEDAMQQYAASNGLLILETDNGATESVMNQSLRELQEELNHAQDARYEKESLYRLTQSGDSSSLPGVLDDKLLQDLSMRLADLQREHAQLAATFLDSYPRVAQTQSQIAQIQTALDQERLRAVQKIGNDYFAAVRQEKLLHQAFWEKKQEANVIAGKSVQYGILRRDVDSNKSLYEGLLLRLKEAGVSAGLNASNIRIVDPGTPPFLPVGPKTALNLGIASFLGLALGVAVSFFREHMDQTIRDRNDVSQYLHVPVVAFIPSVASLRKMRDSRLGASDRGFTFHFSDPHASGRKSLIISPPRNDPGTPQNSILSEAFRGLRTSVLLSTRPSAHSILVTSAQCGEGKTTVAMNLAVSLAQLGRRTLLIDADLRRPSVHKYFPGTGGSQLSKYLAGQGVWQEMVRKSSVNDLYVLLGGDAPANPAELLSSDAMRALLKQAAEVYNFVVVDSPPLLNVADSRILANMVDSTLLVVKCGETPRQVVQFAEAQARDAGANLLGVVLNYLDVRTTDYPYRVLKPAREFSSQI
jgi:polysaccharide biosynthesis transport protein